MHLPNMRHRRNTAQDSCRTQAASSHFRNNRQCSGRRGRWLGFALGYRQPWLPTCAIRCRHRPNIRGAHNFLHPRLNSAHGFQPAKRTKVRTWVLQPRAAVRRSSRCHSMDESAHLTLVQSAYLTLVLHPKRILSSVSQLHPKCRPTVLPSPPSLWSPAERGREGQAAG
jgi:hypothetical protein